MKVSLRCHRCHVVFQREYAKTSAARGRTCDYCSTTCHRAAEAIKAAERRQAREAEKDAPREPYQRKEHQRFVFVPSERTRVLENPPAPMATDGRDVSEARPAPRKVEIPARAMPSVVVF